jgi:hypothetical protein
MRSLNELTKFLSDTIGIGLRLKHNSLGPGKIEGLDVSRNSSEVLAAVCRCSIVLYKNYILCR